MTVTARGALLITTACLLVATTAQAQSTTSPQGLAETDSGVEPALAGSGAEIVVTARKRSESVQDVPISIRALGEQELLRLGADSLEEFAGQAPGLQLTGTRTNAQIIMRGVTTGPVNHDQTEIKETVGLYLDETPIAVQRYSPNLKLYDLERIEILRGPQGTLYGAGSMAGAVRMITNKPRTDAIEASARGGFAMIDHGDQSYTLDTMVNVPIVTDLLAVRAVGFFRKNGGYIDNVTTGEDDVNSEEAKGGRIAMRLTPNPDLTIDGLLYYQKSDLRATSTSAEEAGRLRTFVAENEPMHDRNLMTSLTVNQSFDPVDLTFVGSYRRKKYQYFVENGTFTNFVTGFRDGLGGTFDNRANQEDYSSELRLASKPQSPVQWTVGAFYEDRTNFYTQDFTVPGVDAAAGIDSTDYATNPDQLYFSDINVKEQQFAAFGEVVIPVTEQLRVTAGGRYFQSKQNAVIDFRGIFAVPNIGVAAFRNKEHGFNPRINVAYEIDADRMVYAQAARGFRLGGTNEPVPVPACSADLASRGLDSAPETYSSDHLWNYEVGAKTSWFDRKLVVNVAAYRIDWNKPQVTDQLGCGFNVFVNAGGLKINGAELETIIRPTRLITLRAGLGHTNSTLTEDLAFVSGREGDRAPYIARWTYNLSADINYPVGDGIEGFAFASYQNTGGRYTRFNPTLASAYYLPAYGVLNARAGLSTDRWSVELFAENLANSHGEVDRRYNPYPITAVTQVTQIVPRTIGLELTLRY